MIDWRNRPLEAGTYRAKVKATHESGTWEWEEEFTILGEEAEEINEQAVELEDAEGMDLFIWIAGIVLLLVIILLILYIRHLKKAKKRYFERKRRMMRR